MTGPQTARDALDVESVLRTVVQPVVDELLRPAEVESVDLAWRPVRLPPHPGPSPDRGPYQSTLALGEPGWVTEDRLVLTVVAVGERFTFHLAEPDTPLDRVDRDWIADQLHSRLQDFVAESRFGWGELRGRR